MGSGVWGGLRGQVRPEGRRRSAPGAGEAGLQASVARVLGPSPPPSPSALRVSTTGPAGDSALPSSPGPALRCCCHLRPPQRRSLHTASVEGHRHPPGTSWPWRSGSGSRRLALSLCRVLAMARVLRRAGGKPAGGGHHVSQEQGDLFFAHGTHILKKRKTPMAERSASPPGPGRGVQGTEGRGTCLAPGPSEPHDQPPCQRVPSRLAPESN